MINKLINIFWKPEGLEEIKTPKFKTVVFKLNYDDIIVGTLELKNGEWCFTYSNQFKNDDTLSAIIDFPDKNKSYKSEDLWPYFITRIPSLKQPYMKNLMAKKHIDSSDPVDLLKYFGKKTITSPFELVAY